MAKRNEDKKVSAQPDAMELAQALKSVHLEMKRLLAIDELSLPEHISVPIELRDGPRHEWIERAERFLNSVKKQAVHDQARTSAQGFWCFQCRTYECSHCAPRHRAQIFSGYSATGKPTWEAFIDACIRLKPAGMDALFGDRPVPLAMVLDAEDLNEDRLPEFVGQPEAPEFCGQVVAGLLPIALWTTRGSQERAALSIQLLRRRVGDDYVYHLNLMGFSDREFSEAAAKGGHRSKAALLSYVIQRTRRRLKGVRGELATLSGPSEQKHSVFIERVLSQLRGDISQICRSGTLRTKHAEKRRKGGQRPTGNAFSDAREAGVDQVLFDNRHETYVVLGRNQRAHVFSPEGRHVTSLRLQRGEIDRKIQRKRWRPMSRSEYEAFGRMIHRASHPQGKSPKGQRSARK